MFIAFTQMSIQVHGIDVFAHGSPLFGKANAST
jgi:hypothetical protein